VYPFLQGFRERPIKKKTWVEDGVRQWQNEEQSKGEEKKTDK
jgi:hypothetical protein